MEKVIYSEVQQQFREPPPASLTINAVSPNSSSTRHHATSPNDYSDDSPGSYTSYSSADYSSIGVLTNNKIKRSTLNVDMRSQDGPSGIVGHGLLSEVLKMQGLLEEYQHALTALEIEKADKQQEISRLDKLLKGKGETEERYKDEIWNLELSKQELLQKIHDLSQSLSRSTAEQNRLAKQEEKLCQEIEQFKTVQHTWESSLAAAQEQHEEETLALKKMLYSLRIEKDQVAKQLQEVLAIQQQQNGLRHIDTSLSSSEGPASSTPTVAVASSSPDNNTRVVHSKSVVATRHEAEITALKTSLDQAHGIIQTMQAKIDEERQERTEIDKLLREAQETIEQFSQHYSPSTSQPYSPTLTDSLPPHSPASISNRQQRTSLRSTGKFSLGRKRLTVTGSSPYPQRGKSLGDELSQAGSVGNLMATSPISSSNDESLYCNNSIASLKKSVTLTCVELPPITNHGSLSSLLSSSSVPSASNEQTQVQSNEYFGSLLREPTSYIYKSKRDKETADTKQKQKLPLFKLNFGDHDFRVDADFSQQHGEGNDDDDDDGSSATAMTRTMIGDWMWKYTRKVVGSGISENRHRRFFWLHPYTQTLYWSTQEPGTKANQCSTKSVLVESFLVLPPHEKSKPPGIYIKSPSRGIQIQCLDFTAHYAWIKSLRYLLSDADHTQHVIPTIKKATTGKTTLDRKKFSSLRQKNRSFTRLLDQTPSLPNSALRYDASKEQVASFAGRQDGLQSLFNNSTLIDLTIDQGPLIDLNTLRHE
ncbi:hypothetical protein PS6_009431 [Mucor atramentarius]